MPWWCRGRSNTVCAHRGACNTLTSCCIPVSTWVLEPSGSHLAEVSLQRAEEKVNTRRQHTESIWCDLWAMTPLPHCFPRSQIALWRASCPTLTPSFHVGNSSLRSTLVPASVVLPRRHFFLFFQLLGRNLALLGGSLLLFLQIRDLLLWSLHAEQAPTVLSTGRVYSNRPSKTPANTHQSTFSASNELHQINLSEWHRWKAQSPRVTLCPSIQQTG